MLKSLIEDPGIGTTCLDDLSENIAQFQKCQYTEDGFTDNFTVSHILYKPVFIVYLIFCQGPGYYEEQCACRHTEWICKAEKERTNIQRWIVNTTDVLHDLTNYDKGSINDWLLKTHYSFIDQRFGGWSAANFSQYAMEVNGKSENLIVWYNNKAHHALPSYLNSIHNAKLRTLVKEGGGDPTKSGITTYVHPMALATNKLTVQEM